jgi:hypothetical protein
MGKSSEIQECLQVLNTLHTGTYYSMDELVAKMPSSVPRKTLVVVLDHTVALKITTRIGSHYLIRRQTSREDFLTICGELSVPAPDGPAALPSDRIKRLEDDVEDLQQIDYAQHYWLKFNFDRMPAGVKNPLREQALKLTGAGASDYAVETQMLLIAARILTHALRVPLKEPPSVLPPRPLD